MQSNLYESMAAGVQNACCVVCFMAAAYEASENCALELQFARQSGVPIVPVLMQAGYKASGWLGIVTAGALWCVGLSLRGLSLAVRPWPGINHGRWS